MELVVLTKTLVGFSLLTFLIMKMLHTQYNSVLISEEVLLYMLMMFSNSLELMIYGGLEVGLLEMYLIYNTISLPENTLLLFMVPKVVVMVLWM